MSLSKIIDKISLGKIVLIREQLLKAQASGKKVYRLESGDPNFSLAPHVLRALSEAAEKGKTHYVPNNGIPELKNALYEKICKKNKIQLPSVENVFVTNGAMHALFVTFAVLLKDGDEVIVPDPMWTEVVENIRLAGGNPVPVALHAKNNFEYCPADIESKITSLTKAIFLNTPHNPTGAVLSAETLLEIGRIAKKHGLYIISDEAYEDVIFGDKTHNSIAALMPEYLDKIISIYSFSKSYAMSGLRVGYIATSDLSLNERIPKLLRCTINGVNSVAQWAALAAVTGDQSFVSEMRQEYLARRDILLNALDGIDGVTPFVPRGTFFLWVELSESVFKRLHIHSVDELSAILAEKGIGSSPGDCFGDSCSHSIRFAFSCATTMVEEGAFELRKCLMG